LRSTTKYPAGGFYMICFPSSKISIDRLEVFYLTGKHQPKALCKGLLVLSKKFSDLGNGEDSEVLFHYEYSAYAVWDSFDLPILVLHRKTSRDHMIDFGQLVEVCVYSKYLIPKDRSEVQKFDCPNPEEKYAMRPQYEEFVQELSQIIYDHPNGFYLSIEDLTGASDGK
jgi:hypothetical protein